MCPCTTHSPFNSSSWQTVGAPNGTLCDVAEEIVLDEVEFVRQCEVEVFDDAHGAEVSHVERDCVVVAVEPWGGGRRLLVVVDAAVSERLVREDREDACVESHHVVQRDLAHRRVT